MTEAEMPKTADGVELDDETREDLARWQSYVETGHAIPHETVMAGAFPISRSSV